MVTLYYSTQEQVEEYYSSPALNQSYLKTFCIPKEYKEDVKEEEEMLPMQELLQGYREPKNLLLGDYLDGYLTRQEKFLEERYFWEPISEKPSDNIMNIIRYYFNEISSEDLSLKGPLIKIARDMQYRNNYSDDKLYETIVKEGGTYFTYLKRAEGKIILSEEEYQITRLMLSKVDESKYKTWIFETPWKFFGDQIQSPDYYYEVHLQKPIYFMLDGVECKALLDILVVEKDINTGEVTRAHVCDLKSTGFALFKFYQSVNKFRYDFQISFYTLAAADLLDIPVLNITQSFLVVSKVNKHLPMIHVHFPEEYFMRTCDGDVAEDSPDHITEFIKENGYFPRLGIYQALDRCIRESSPEDSRTITLTGTEFILTDTGFKTK